MMRLRSYRSKLQIAFVALGLAAIGATGWEAWDSAADSLRVATYDRLAVARETKGSQLEQYFRDLSSYTSAVAADESTITAIESFSRAWKTLHPAPSADVLQRYYAAHVDQRMRAAGKDPAAWFPGRPQPVALQTWYLAQNPNLEREKDLLLAAPSAGAYGAVHTRHHPTLHRYLTAFGLYDIFLIDAEGHILYTVMKEVDLGMNLKEEPYQSTGLGRVFERAMTQLDADAAAIEDYSPYPASYFAPASFVAAPIFRAGVKIGVLAIQVSVREVNRVMTGDGAWKEQGLGETGQAYVVGVDGRLRSDLRFQDQEPGQTSILRVKVNAELEAKIRNREAGTELGSDSRGVTVLRSFRPLAVPGVDWAVVVEIENSEALRPAVDLRRRMEWIGVLVALAFFLSATFLANSVTRPVRALAAAARRMADRDFATRIVVNAEDEIGELAATFNRMAENLEQTTVSRRELEALAGKLIHAQEDERRRLARELHDDLTQRLAAVAIEAGRLQRMGPGEQEQVQAGLQRIKEQMAKISTDVHGISRGLHPSMLDDLGLVAALESECRNSFERGGPPVHFTHEGGLESIPRQVKLALYRIAQEGLHNIRRHANAASVSLRLEHGTGDVRMTLSDDGAGFNRQDPEWRPGLGLASMEERVRWLGGELRIQSQPGKGTRIDVRIQTNAETNSSIGG